MEALCMKVVTDGQTRGNNGVQYLYEYGNLLWNLNGLGRGDALFRLLETCSVVKFNVYDFSFLRYYLLDICDI